MPRRSPRKHEPIGPRLRTARNDAGLTLKEAADLTGISAASLSHFETNRSQPSFGDICLFAEKLAWPLLFFATGRLRTGTDGRALAAQLFHWGLVAVTRDLFKSIQKGNLAGSLVAALKEKRVKPFLS